ncbi:MAG: phosphoglycerate mutase [Rhodobacteraceae bacterium]|nr:phosphoglycerate mutase [Paracoccaceae bacterium]MBR27694.1 phosphoglycerate mutase [Paracoccaceae bacterium]
MNARPLVMRHPAVAAAPGLCYGRHDPGLAPGWEAAADALRPRLADRGAIIASPAPRCLLPARRLAAALAIPLRVDPRWQELDFGAWEGRPWAGIPRAESDPWAEDPEHRAPPRGETFAALRARVAEAWAEAEAAPAPLVLAHAGPIRALRMALAGLDFAAAFAWPAPHLTPLDPAA